MTIGIRVNILVGSKNQKSPTPIVKNKGNISVTSVISHPKPSLRAQANIITVRTPRSPILKNRYCSGNNWIPTNPKDKIKEVTIKRSLLLINLV